MSTMTVSAGVRFGGRAGRRPMGPVRTSAVPRPAAGPRPVSPGLRLTRRGRLLASAAALLLLVVAAVLLSGGPPATAGTDRGGRPAVADRVTVQPGETLWAIAGRVAPGSDPRDTVQAILDLNGLQTAQVQAGTALVMPGR